MARKPRVQFEGAFYHVTARGNQQRAIFDDDRDRTRFLETLGQACDRHGIVVHPWSSHRAYAGTGARPPWLLVEWLSYWLEISGGRTQSAAQRQYRRDIAGAFGQPVDSPLKELLDGLVLGGDALWKKAQKILKASPRRDADGLRWVKRQGMAQARAWVAEMSAAEADPRVRTWMRVVLGGERMSVVARELGYADASGVFRVIARLEARATEDKALARTLARLRRSMAERQAMK